MTNIKPVKVRLKSFYRIEKCYWKSSASAVIAKLFRCENSELEERS